MLCFYKVMVIRESAGDGTPEAKSWEMQDGLPLAQMIWRRSSRCAASSTYLVAPVKGAHKRSRDCQMAWERSFAPMQAGSHSKSSPEPGVKQKKFQYAVQRGFGAKLDSALNDPAGGGERTRTGNQASTFNNAMAASPFFFGKLSVANKPSEICMNKNLRLWPKLPQKSPSYTYGPIFFVKRRLLRQK